MRSKLVFFLAIGMGVFTTVLFFSYINQLDEAEAKEEKVMIPVVAAAEQISENQIVSSEMLKTIEVAEEDAHPLAVRDIGDIEGKFATTDLETDEIILSHRLKDNKEESEIVSRKVQDGYRAVSVGVDIVRSVANLIEPEDYVDVVLSEIIDLDDTEDVRTEQILTKVRVLAVGQKMYSEPEEEGEAAEYMTVTLELKPEDASTLINATEKGTVQFTLHSSIIASESE
ncbi:Flp pilus assembly protein CpaB [Evansella sp. LMS18]|jgi:pilus assembly protein CpaB|uniref:Flp pilus assembly protein CpaB n=1 Tax=Evansella sp. LMS18 TaxID=2924033 RepID=UPI0020D08292|nr:Flp pilus assembly protein CpaB [Evansella sp. LMS18]UTR12324.1 Flp pilus assembly protein CpaB [Evansella sp. LMS18]